jgi:HEAT repeat protein
MNETLQKLRGGDRRSIGRSEEVARAASKTPALFAELFQGLFEADPLIRMRAADALEKATRTQPALLQPWKRPLLEAASSQQQKEVRWHLAQMLPRLTLTSVEQKRVVKLLMGYLADASSIVRTSSLQALVDLAEGDVRLLAQVRPLVERLTQTGTAAMRARGRKLLPKLRRAT